MDMGETGVWISGGAVGVLAGLASTYIKSMVAARRQERATARCKAEILPQPLGVEIRAAYATKADLADLETRIDARMGSSIGGLRSDIVELRRTVAETDTAAEARASATHKRIDDLLKLIAEKGFKK